MFDAHSASEILLSPTPPWLTLSCEHAANRVPGSWSLSDAERRLLEDHWGWDLGAAELTRRLSSRLSADAILGTWSRLVADLNRPEDHPELCREEAEGVPFAFNQDLTREARQQRLAEVHGPFHLAYAELLERRPPELLLSIHSFTPEYRGPRGTEKRELEVGVLYDRPMAHLGTALHTELCALGLHSEENRPYSGLEGLIESVQRHGQAAGVPYLELEVRNDLLRDDASLEALSERLSLGLIALRARLHGPTT